MSEMHLTQDQCEKIIAMRQRWREQQDVHWCLAAGFVDMEKLQEARKWRALQRAGLVAP